MNASAPRTNLLGLTRSGLEAFVTSMGEKPFRARQLMKWLYKRHVADFDQMTDLARSFRERLREVAEVRVVDRAYEIRTPRPIGPDACHPCGQQARAREA